MNWGREREYREGIASLREVLQAHVHFTIGLSWDRKPIHHMNVLNIGANERQWEHWGEKKKKKTTRLRMLPAVPVCTGVSSWRGSWWRVKATHQSLPNISIQEHLRCIYLGPKANLCLVEEGSLLQHHSPQPFRITKPYLIGMNWGTASQQDTR